MHYSLHFAFLSLLMFNSHFFEMTINLLLSYNISCNVDESFLMTEFHLSVFAFTFVYVN